MYLLGCKIFESRTEGEPHPAHETILEFVHKAPEDTQWKPMSPVVRSSHCSYQVSNLLVPSPFGAVCFWLAMVFPGDFANESVPRTPLGHPST